jgi:hypothetical protein
VLDRPKQIGRGPFDAGIREIRGCGPQSERERLGRAAGRAMAARTLRAIESTSSCNERRILQWRRIDRARVVLNGAAHCRLQQPENGRRMLVGGGDVVQARIDQGYGTGHQDKRAYDEADEQAHPRTVHAADRGRRPGPSHPAR